MVFQLTILPIIIHPKPGELFSSWLFRLAAANFTKTHTFCRFHLPKHNVWNRDIDKLAPDTMIKRLSLLTEIPFETIFDLTLRSYQNKIFKGYNINGNQRWILPLGIFHRTWTSHGLQFCPVCLATDSEPYYRKSWRLGLSVVCPTCQIPLHDRCPDCSAPISFFRTEVGFKTSLGMKSIATCFNCDFDLRKSPRYPAAIGSKAFQMKLNKIVSTGFWKEQIPSSEYFDVLYQVIRMMRSNSRCYLNFQNFLMEIENQRIRQLPKSYEFEKFPTLDREIFIRIGSWLLEQWPNRFIDICRQTKTSTSAVLKDVHVPPSWFNADTLKPIHQPSAIDLNLLRKIC